MAFQPLDDRYQALLTAIVQGACQDVLNHCRRRRSKGSAAGSSLPYAARMRKTYSHKVAVDGLAWLLGLRAGELPIRAICAVLGLDHTRLVDRLEQAIGRSRFLELQEMASNLYGPAAASDTRVPREQPGAA